MNKVYIIFCLMLFITSCSLTKTIKMKVYENGKKVTYSIKPNNKYTLKKQKGELYTEYQMLFPDNTIMYITDDYESGGAINNDKVKKFGDAVFIKIAVSDTLDLKGKSENNKYWREKKNYNIVVGYINASKKRKKELDKVIALMKRK